MKRFQVITHTGEKALRECNPYTQPWVKLAREQFDSDLDNYPYYILTGEHGLKEGDVVTGDRVEICEQILFEQKTWQTREHEEVEKYRNCAKYLGMGRKEIEKYIRQAAHLKDPVLSDFEQSVLNNTYEKSLRKEQVKEEIPAIPKLYWISVKDRLPNPVMYKDRYKSMCVVISDRGHYHYEALAYYGGGILDETDISWHIIAQEHGHIVKDDNITHYYQVPVFE